MTTSHQLQHLIFDPTQVSEIIQIIRSTDRSNTQNSFLHLTDYLYKNDLYYPSDWVNWKEGLGIIKNFEKNDFSKVHLITNLFLVITLFRGERFNEGLIDLHVNNGLIGKILDGIYIQLHSAENILDENKIKIALKNGKEGVEKYSKIMKAVQLTKIDTDRDFQKSFNHFYRIRQRSNEFYELYYNYLEENKENSKLTFEEVLKYFHEKLGRFEPSFASKILATIQPDMPIWDSFIIGNLGFKAPSNTTKNRFNETVFLYEKICYFYKLIKNSENGKNIIAQFDTIYPNSGMTDTKKIDFMIWQLR